MKKSPKGVLLASNGTEMQVQGRTSSTAGRLLGRGHSIYSIPATNVKLAGKSQHSFLVSAEKDASDRESCEDMYYNILLKMLRRTLRWAVFSIELLEVKVTIDFYRQCHKNLTSAQCVNCSGCLVTTNFEIPASKFPFVVSGSKYT
jgi:hypothetical protein